MFLLIFLQNAKVNIYFGNKIIFRDVFNYSIRNQFKGF